MIPNFTFSLADINLFELLMRMLLALPGLLIDGLLGGFGLTS